MKQKESWRDWWERDSPERAIFVFTVFIYGCLLILAFIGWLLGL